MSLLYVALELAGTVVIAGGVVVFDSSKRLTYTGNPLTTKTLCNVEFTGL